MPLRHPPPLLRVLVPLCVSTAHSFTSHSANARKATEDPDVVDMQAVLSALGLLSGVFLLVLIVLRIYLHCARRRPQRQERRKKMTLADIEARFPVTKCEADTEDACVVCLSNIEAGEDIRVTQCGHTFHSDCLQQWWLHKPRRVLRCPICRKKQRTREGRPRNEARGVDASCVGGAADEGVAAGGEELSSVRVDDAGLASASPRSGDNSPENPNSCSEDPDDDGIPGPGNREDGKAPVVEGIAVALPDPAVAMVTITI
mmetsp:Transcript_46375/g.133562  ORF Transcript_46375/g.133562 Transcript_46375/m.133562 type:complete len:259 (+) Transcript_46375:89-865(+)